MIIIPLSGPTARREFTTVLQSLPNLSLLYLLLVTRRRKRMVFMWPSLETIDSYSTKDVNIIIG